VATASSLFDSLSSHERNLLLGRCYSSVARIAFGLTGRKSAGREVVRFVMSRGIRQLDSWRDESEADAYFLHHAVLTARRATPASDGRDDLLVTASTASSDPNYVSFVRALRSLPGQQTEAFLLSTGQSLNARWLGVAMDCSATAAAAHLEAAKRALQQIAGASYDQLVSILIATYRSLAPDEKLAIPVAQGLWKRHAWPRRIGHLIGMLLIGSALVVVAFVVRWLWRVIEV